MVTYASAPTPRMNAITVTESDYESDTPSLPCPASTPYKRKKRIVVPEGVPICSHVGCPRPARPNRKLCEKCAERGKQFAKTEKAKAAVAKYKASDKYKQSLARQHAGEAYKASKRRFRQSDKGRAADKVLHAKMARSLRSMLTGHNQTPVTFKTLGLFESNDEVKAHFESTFEPWMSHDNADKYKKNDAYNTKWNIGHRIPKILYDHSNEEDVMRCWSRVNLFAQCARQNVEQRNMLFLSDAELLSMQAIWPVAANKDLTTLKALYKPSRRVCVCAS